MSIVNANSVISIHYTLRNEEGETLDSSEGQQPLNYLHGAGNIIPGLENALAGLNTGDSFSVTVQPEQGYGELNPDMIQKVPRSAFEGFEGELVAGMPLTASGANGETMNVTIIEVDDEHVTVNGNHPLAGMVLCFSGTVEAVREATSEELEHGHAH
ncbi:FKBP-type peptidyl-prolyl cis-trans isomerase SlyD [Sinobacterium caligoides]|uniref:Peptidyl-prolyl cis-trans isomerase n=1 Tax=Sinobacterium caligoides TaxID=933926 RepID=A0A3N2DNY7_9GAMM|nr:peptidylprolyl isomerase [Sinobacterium caligoides]ROS01412.1 FKBP-type peptidyl-prolyl cis-trans isomerase SlyD [Sinobacterium caligoides]